MPQPAEQRILVVDDDDDVLMALCAVLNTEGYATDSARDGSAALEWLSSCAQCPAMILVDWNMAPMNGKTFIETLRRQNRYSEVPIVLLSADHRLKMESLSGVTYFLRKPVQIDELMRCVTAHCSLLTS